MWSPWGRGLCIKWTQPSDCLSYNVCVCTDKNGLMEKATLCSWLILLNVCTEGISPIISGAVCLSVGYLRAYSPYPSLPGDISSCAASASPRFLPSLFLALFLSFLAPAGIFLPVCLILVYYLHFSSVASSVFYLAVFFCHQVLSLCLSRLIKDAL